MAYYKKNYCYIVLLTILFISFYRSPHIFLEGRFWGEDGQLFFQNALGYSFFDHFFKFHEISGGYYELFPRVVALIATKFPLEYAPLVNVYMSYVIIFYIFVLTIFCKSYLFESRNQKFLLCYLILFCSSFAPDIWVNSTNSQIYFGVLAILILYLKSNNKIIYKIINSVILFIGGLSSFYVIVLFPLFFFKSYLIKSRNFVYEKIIILFSFLLQLSHYLYIRATNSMIDFNRAEAFLNNFSFKFIDIYYIKVFFYNVFLKTIFSKKIVLLSSNFLDYLNIHNYLLIFILILTLIFFIFFLTKIFLFIRHDTEKLIILSSLIVIFLTILVGIILVSGTWIFGRYASILGFIFALSILFLSFQKTITNLYSFILKFFLILIFLSGISQFRPNDYQITFLDCLDGCVPWKEQIANLDNRNSYKIMIWPYNFTEKWYVSFKK